MRIGRTLPPVAASLPWRNIWRACLSCLKGKEEGIAAFEREIKEQFGSKYCFLVSSGKAALTLILQTLHQMNPERDEVLIPAYTCFSVPASIKRAGLKIRLCDLGANTLDFDKTALGLIAGNEEDAGRLLCVIPTHLFGIPADIEFCRGSFPPEVSVVEDAAQAMGEVWRDKMLGTIGDIGFFSLGRGKALSTVEGGIILTDRDDIGEALAKNILSLPQYSRRDQLLLTAKSVFIAVLQQPWLFWLPKSMPFLRLGETIYDPAFAVKKFSSISAALAIDWKTRLDKFQQRRKKNIKEFFDTVNNEREFFPWGGEDRSLIRLPGLIEKEKVRNAILGVAAERGLGIMGYYPAPINEIEDLVHDFPAGEDYPVAKRLSDQLITVPTHEYMEEGDYLEICRCLTDCSAWAVKSNTTPN